MEAIIVDTSSILFGLSKKIDVFQAIGEQLGYRPVISKGVMRELESIAKKGGRYSRYAAAATDIISKHNTLIEKNNGFVDRWILSNFPKYGNVCTNDSKLKRELRSMGASVYSISIGGTLR